MSKRNLSTIVLITCLHIESKINQIFQSLFASQTERTSWHLSSFSLVMLVWTAGPCPLWVPEWYAPKVSQYMFDPHSFMHILHGIILHLIMGRFIPLVIGFPLALLLELAWENLENTDFWIEMTSGAPDNNQEEKESIHHLLDPSSAALLDTSSAASSSTLESGGSALSGLWRLRLDAWSTWGTTSSCLSWWWSTRWTASRGGRRRSSELRSRK